MFAVSPQLETKKTLIFKAATVPLNGKARTLLFIEVKRAHLSPRCEQSVYFKLPEEANSEKGNRGKFVYWLYGFRPAAQGWENRIAEKFVGAGFRRGPDVSVAFCHSQKGLACVVHAGDVAFVARTRSSIGSRRRCRSGTRSSSEADSGPTKGGDDEEASIIGRVVMWRSWGIECAAGPRHRLEVMKYF